MTHNRSQTPVEAPEQRRRQTIIMILLAAAIELAGIVAVIVRKLWT